MEKYYHLKAIQKNHSNDFLSIAASIYLGERRIGVLHTCPDTKEMEFEFALAMDRLVFENFISDWWARADRRVHSESTEPAMIQAHPASYPSLPVKMDCWVKSIVLSLPSTVQTNELAAA